MLRFATLALISILLVCSGPPARATSAEPESLPPGAVVLRVEVLDNVATGLVPAHACPEGMQCIQMNPWAKYRARVKEVISGDWHEAEVTFARLEHAPFIPEATRDCYVILRPASPQIHSRIGVPFVAQKLLTSFGASDRAAIKALRKVP